VFSLVCGVALSTLAESNLRFERCATTVPHENCKRVMSRMTKALPIAIAALCLVSCDEDDGTGGAASGRRTVGGSVSGLRGTGLVLQNNGGDPLTISADGSFTFATPLAPFAPYSVTVLTQPTATPAEVCSVASGNGTVGRDAIANVTIACRGTTGKYLYALSGGTDPKASGFLIDPFTGTLTEIPGSPSSIRTDSGGPNAIFASGRFLFITGQYVELRRWLTGYAVDVTTGALTLIPGTPLRQSLITGQPFFDPQGRGLYIVSDQALHAYSIDPTNGALTLTRTPGLPHDLGASFSVGVAPPFNSAFNAFNPEGTTAFVMFGGDWRSFAVDATSGVLTYQGVIYAGSSAFVVHPRGKFAFLRGTHNFWVVGIEDPTSMPVVTSLTIAQELARPVGAIIDETAQYVYVVGDERAAQQASGRFLFGFRFDAASGVLTPLARSPYPLTNTNNTPRLAMDPLRRFIVAYHQAFGVAVFKIDASTGEVVEVPGSPFTPTVGVVPAEIVFDPSGNFAYMTDRPSSSVSAYSFDSTNGRFAFVGSYPLPAQPVGAVIVGSQ
jgi:6-phosphogluconolactonase (cycloisomerase 2 family)